MREFTISLPCPMAAEEFWALRSDTGFDDYFAALDRQQFQCLKNDVHSGADGHQRIYREFKLCALDNPIPKALRGLLPKGVDSTSLRVNCSFATERFDEAHPCARHAHRRWGCQDQHQ